MLAYAETGRLPADWKSSKLNIKYVNTVLNKYMLHVSMFLVTKGKNMRN